MDWNPSIRSGGKPPRTDERREQFIGGLIDSFIIN